MRVLFCGNPEFAVPTLGALLESTHQVVGVVCSPDKPRGRGKRLIPLPVKQKAIEAALPVLQPESLSDANFLAQVKSMAADCAVVVAFRILPREFFALPRLGSFNVHPSLLPKYRGPAPIRWTLMNGDTETGVTIIQLTERIDGGGMLAQRRAAVADNENFGSLHDRLSGIGAQMLVQVLEDFEQGRPPTILSQDDSLVTRAPKLFPKDFQIDWNDPAEKIRNKIRALSPSPGAISRSGGSVFKILAASVISDAEYQAGMVRIVDEQLYVGTGKGVLRLEQVQPEGKRVMACSDYLRGRPKLPERFL